MKTLTQAEKEAKDIVNSWSVGATAVSWVPFSALVLGGADTLMITSVAAAFEVTGYDPQKVGAAVAASISGRWLAETLSFIPGPEWIVKAMIAGGITKGMGEGVIAYFRGQSSLK